MGSNPGSRVGSHKANARAGDQTTIIKKQYINPAGNQPAAERFVAPGTIIRAAPKIGLGGAPTITKPGNGSARGAIPVRTGGSQDRVQKVTIVPSGNAGGSHGAIKTTTQPMGA